MDESADTNSIFTLSPSPIEYISIPAPLADIAASSAKASASSVSPGAVARPSVRITMTLRAFSLCPGEVSSFAAAISPSPVLVKPNSSFGSMVIAPTEVETRSFAVVS